MESSLSLDNYMKQNEVDQDLAKDEQKKELIDLEEKIRCVTVECMQKQLDDQIEQVEEQLTGLIEKNTNRLRNIWKHHKDLVLRVAQLEQQASQNESKNETAERFDEVGRQIQDVNRNEELQGFISGITVRIGEVENGKSEARDSVEGELISLRDMIQGSIDRLAVKER
jgi:hypothetical protein